MLRGCEVDNVNTKLIIIKNNIRQVINYAYSIDGIGNITMRAKAESRAYAHGGTLVGDGYIESKKIKISIDIKAETQEKHDEAVNNLINIFMGRDYKLINERIDSYYNVAGMESIKSQYEKSFKNRWSSIDINLILTDPFRYAVNEVIDKHNMQKPNADGYYYINVLNYGSVDTPLTIKLNPDTQLPNIEITHIQTGRQCKLTDSMLVVPCTTVIDGKAGTVYRDKYNAINAYSGQFLSAKVGENTYRIKATGTGEIELVTKMRWLI